MYFKMNCKILLLLCHFYYVVGSLNGTQQAPACSWNSRSNVSLLYLDDHVAFCSTPIVNQTSVLPALAPISQAWQLVQSIYNSELFGQDPRLYVILGDPQRDDEILTHKSNTTAFFNNSFPLIIKNVVHCELDASTKNEIGQFHVRSLNSIINQATTLVRQKVHLNGNSTNLVHEWDILGIIAYDSLMTNGSSKDANDLKQILIGETINFPQKNIKIFSDWYFPIYEHHGGSEAIAKFIDLYKSLDESESISPGEFVHLWSQAVGHDLRDLAYRAFGWIPDYRNQFREARDKFNCCSYSESYPNASWYTPPLIWHEHWKSKENLTRVYYNGHVAFYFDQYMPTTVTWPFKLLSDAWIYSKETYGPFGPDPILYVILRTGDRNECWKSKETTLLDTEYALRNVIDCEQPGYTSWNEETAFNANGLMHEISVILLRVFKETGYWPGQSVTEWRMGTILTYDICLALGRLEDAERWKEFMLIRVDDYPWKNTFWFRDWYFPIYTRYGGKDVLIKFHDLLFTYWPRKGTNYVSQLNVGDFVHFWSGAVGADLKALGVQTFSWNSKNEDELAKARLKYPQINYTREVDEKLPQTWKEHWSDHEDLLSLAYSDDHVALYVDANMNATSVHWAFKLMSSSWTYAKKTYVPREDPLLYVVLHQSSSSSCITSKASTYLDKTFEGKNAIDCGLLHPHKGNLESSANVDILLTQLALVIMRNAEETGNWPGFKVSRWTMTDILVYDIYLCLGRLKDAKRWKTQKWKATEVVPRPKTFWFKDWYYPIYERYGGAHAFTNFFRLLRREWEVVEQDYVRNFDLGTMVHFWSGAVGENLWYLAAEAFGWGAWDHKKFIKARTNYLGVNYTETYQNSPVSIPPETWKEHWKGHKETLTLVHMNAHVAVYFDSQMDLGETWMFQPLSDAWRYIKETYGPFGPDPFLYVVLHDGVHEGCITSRGSSYVDNEFEYLTVLDCGRLYDNWALANGMENIVDELGRVILRGSKKVGFWPAWIVSRWQMGNILTYDIYLGIGKTHEASEWLRKCLQKQEIVPMKNTFWFREWFYPIYSKYGQAKVLNNFLSLLFQHWPKEATGLDYAKELNVGEYLHFWSGAAGVNLKYLISKTVKWIEKYEMEFKNARKEYPAITYRESNEEDNLQADALIVYEYGFGHRELLVQVYTDRTTISIYFDGDTDRSIAWPLTLLPKAWQQAQATYDTVRISPNSILRVYLHSKKLSGCRTMWNESRGGSMAKENILDCGKNNGATWTDESKANQDELLTGFADIIYKSARIQKPNDAFTQILLFDAYIKLGKFLEAYQLLNETFERNELRSGSEGYGLWMRDWYLPIYTNFSGVSVLNEYLSLLSLTNSQKSNKKIITGYHVHFWSAAVGTNLFKSAEHTFGWKQQGPEIQAFVQARNDFPQLTYSCYDCNLFEAPGQVNFLTVGFSVGFSIVLITTVAIVIVLYRFQVRRLKEQIRELTNDEIKEFFEGNGKECSTDDFNASIESKPFNQDYEIPRDRLEISHDNVLGSGEFGLVLCGVMKGVPGQDEIDKVVAVKTVKPNVDITYFKALLVELKVMGFLGTHPNIASLLGAFTLNIKKREVYVALEFCSNGDLLGYMRSHKDKFKDLFANDKYLSNSETTSNEREAAITPALNHESEDTSRNANANSTGSFSTLDLLKWSHQIANGMMYISSKKVIHGDLAARNVLLTADNVAKISDFGLSRQLENYSNYMKSSKTPVPWRWMAIEALRDMNFSIQSDIWSYGVTLYEIFSIGIAPYAGWTWDYEFVDKLVAGHRLSKPQFGNEQVYNIMMDCMKKDPKERIAFVEIFQKLQVIMTETGLKSSSNVNSNYEQML